MHTEIDTIIIFTQAMDELARFYQNAFNLGEPNLSPGHLGFNLGPVYLGFDQVEKRFEKPGGVTVWFRVDNIEETFQKLIELGGRVHYPPTEKPWGDRLAAVYDPDGNLLGVSGRSQPTDPKEKP